MKIEKLISIFEKCIPTYQKAVDENWNFELLTINCMCSGLCYFIGKGNTYSREYIQINNIFGNYYGNYINSFGYLFNPASWEDKNETSKCIKPRLKFLKQQVKELKELQKQGYTNV